MIVTGRGGLAKLASQLGVELHRFEQRLGVGQHSPQCLGRGPLRTVPEGPGKGSKDHMLVALGESRDPRPPLRVARLTRTPGAQVFETGRLRHRSRECDNAPATLASLGWCLYRQIITVPSLLRRRFRRATFKRDPRPRAVIVAGTLRWHELGDTFCYDGGYAPHPPLVRSPMRSEE